MKNTIKKHTERLAILKENRAMTVDINTDTENELYDQLIKQVAEFIRDLKQLNLPVVMPRFSEITTESDDKAFSWILQNDTNADHPENNSDMIRRLVHKYNDLIKYLNGA